jgi:hypothetical protein
MSLRRRALVGFSAAAMGLVMICALTSTAAFAGTAVTVPADSAFTAHVVERNPNATFQHNAKLISGSTPLSVVVVL